MTTLAYYRLWGRNLAFKLKAGHQMTKQDDAMASAGTVYNSKDITKNQQVNRTFDGMYSGY